MSRRNYNKEYIENRESFRREEPPKRKPVVSPGVVVNCEKLNVRKEPNTASEVVNIINKDDLVRVFHNDSTNNFYKILMVRHRERPLSDETIEGFCMKSFIEIK